MSIPRQSWPAIKTILFALLVLTTHLCLAADSTKVRPRVAVQTVQTSTSSTFNLLRNLNWQVHMADRHGKTLNAYSRQPDTLFESFLPDTVVLSADFRTDTLGLGDRLALRYELSGSMAVMADGQQVIATGKLYKGKARKFFTHTKSGYIALPDADSSLHLQVTYVPSKQARAFELTLIVESLERAIARHEETEADNRQTFGTGFYFLALGIVYGLLFMYFREKKENLYFSLFCFLVALSCVWESFQTDTFTDLDSFFNIIAFEMLSIFLYKVLKDKEKSKIPLLVILLTFLVCLIPAVRYRYWYVSGEPIPIVLAIVFVALYGYTCIYVLYLLLAGIGQKRWEARVILWVCLTPIVLLVIDFIAIIVAAVIERGVKSASIFASSVEYFITFISFSYPLAAVIILGRRNGLTQQQLTRQIASIQQLSEEKLAVEQEKKQILEKQNERLEAEVAERTGEVVRQKEEIRRQHDELKIEKEKSDELLRNILPENVANELREKGFSEARLFDNVTVLFADFVNFTDAGESMSPKELVNELDACFKAFDGIISHYNIEKIKTIGDAYLAVCGLPQPDEDHAAKCVSAAIEIVKFMEDRFAVYGENTFRIRVGIHSGSVVAGIVGVKKFAYDIWGDTVNTAARMEQNSDPGKINISETTYQMIKDRFTCLYRGEIEAKNKGALKMYFVG